MNEPWNERMHRNGIEYMFRFDYYDDENDDHVDDDVDDDNSVCSCYFTGKHHY